MAQHTAPDASAIRETKVVLLGASGVGKTCIAERFINREVSVTMPTIGAAYLKRTYSTAKGLFEFQVWDTAGQEKYRSLAPMYYRETSAVVIVFDLTNPTTFESAKQWVKEFRISGPDNAVMILAGNKVDLTTERAIGDDLANAYAEEIGAFYIETSAIADINIEKIFVTIGMFIHLLCNSCLFY
eukprot:TRINITY_DN1225_c0_g1_i7.p1 TRINITY_DN1225_c0_g1~~TRINITY_DN1225_c0_g1_i7.p1  ORF type:complete len:185 (+),score=29.85 TRINITY_DN1225_c0_g1_i7:68-622(+)